MTLKSHKCIFYLSKQGRETMGTALGKKKFEERLSSPAVVFSVITVLFLISRIIMYVVYCRYTGNSGFSSFALDINEWDCGWYKWYILNIADDLNILDATPATTGQAWWAFFPLFPSVTALFWKIFGGGNEDNVFYIGQALNTVFFLIAQYYGHRYIMLTRKSLWAAYSYVAFMSLGLYSFYFSIIYTEALFLMLLTLCFYFMKQKKYVLMGISGALLSATRNAGIMFVFVILTELITEYVREGNHGGIFKSTKEFIVTNLKKPTLIFGTCLVPMGFFLYMALLSNITGDGLAFLHVQRAWGKNTDGLIANLKDAFYYSFPPSYLSLSVLLIIALIIITCARQKNFPETVFSAIILLTSASSSFDSVPRYAIGSFTFVLAFSDEFAKFRPVTKIVIGTIICLFEITLIKYWFAYSSWLV